MWPLSFAWPPIIVVFMMPLCHAPCSSVPLISMIFRATTFASMLLCLALLNLFFKIPSQDDAMKMQILDVYLLQRHLFKYDAFAYTSHFTGVVKGTNVSALVLCLQILVSPGSYAV